MTTPSGFASLDGARAGDPPAARATTSPAFVKASVAWHAGVGVAALAFPEAWPWALGAVAANHAVLGGAGLVPRSRWLGPNWTRLPAAAAARHEVAITIDDGPDREVTPALLDVLDAHAVKATFFCIAERARAEPALCREIAARGHSVQNHSNGHTHRFALLGPRAIADELARAQATIGELTGVAPRYFRAPAGLRNPFLQPVLDRLGLTLVSWTRRGYDTRRRDPASVLARLVRGLAAGDIVLLHDGNTARTSDGRPVALAVLPPLIERIGEHGLRPVTLPDAVAGPRAPSAHE